MASISVPIERYKHDGFIDGPGHHYQDNYSHNYGHGGRPNAFGPRDNGPPYIAKLLNLPITASDEFVDDLFKSRYTPYVKFKIVVDPSSNILETNIVKKIAFVELQNFQDLSKVLKWQDLYYKASKRVVTELADFMDFQYVMDFNKTHQQQISQIEQDFLAGKFKVESPSRRFQNLNGPPGGGHGRPGSFGTHGMPLNHVHNGPMASHNHQPAPHPQGPLLGKDLNPLQLNGPGLASPPKHKSNPFGAAKPVDVAAKQQEIQKKLITINHTTVRTINPEDETKKESEISKLTEPKAQPHSPEDNGKHVGLRPAPLPEPRLSGLSYAQLLSNKPEETPSPNKNSPKPKVLKPVILKKKQSTPSSSSDPKIDLTAKESDFLKQQQEKIAMDNQFQDQQTATLHDAKSDPVEGVKDELERVELLDNSTETRKDQELKEERPNFKKHFDELSKKPFTPKEKSERKPHPHSNGHHQNPNQGSARGFHNASHRGAHHNYNQSYVRHHDHHKELYEQREPKEGRKSQGSPGGQSPKEDSSSIRKEPKLSGDDKVTRAIENSSKERSKMSARGHHRNSRFQHASKGNSSAKRDSHKPSHGSGSGSERATDKTESPSTALPQPKVSSAESDAPKDLEGERKPEAPTKASDGNAEAKKGVENDEGIDPSEKATKDTGRGNFRGRNRGRGRGRGFTRGKFRGRGDFNLRYLRKHDDDESGTRQTQEQPATTTESKESGN